MYLLFQRTSGQKEMYIIPSDPFGYMKMSFLQVCEVKFGIKISAIQ